MTSSLGIWHFNSVHSYSPQAEASNCLESEMGSYRCFGPDHLCSGYRGIDTVVPKDLPSQVHSRRKCWSQKQGTKCLKHVKIHLVNHQDLPRPFNCACTSCTLTFQLSTHGVYHTSFTRHRVSCSLPRKEPLFTQVDHSTDKRFPR
jgi:hypothetical protein